MKHKNKFMYRTIREFTVYFFYEWINNISRLSCLGGATVYQADGVLHPRSIDYRVLEAATAIQWRENRLLEGVSGSIPSSLGVRKTKRISRGSQIRVRAALRLEIP